jgi:hypothetical protein
LVGGAYFPQLAEFFGTFERLVFKKPRKSTHVHHKTISAPNFFSTKIKFCKKVGKTAQSIQNISFVWHDFRFHWGKTSKTAMSGVSKRCK